MNAGSHATFAKTIAATPSTPDLTRANPAVAKPRKFGFDLYSIISLICLRKKKLKNSHKKLFIINLKATESSLEES